MDTFWLSPLQTNDPAADARLWDAVLAYMQPSGAPRHVRPLQRARVLIATSSDPQIVRAIWGLVPPWAAAAERRSVAQRYRLLDGELTPNSSVLRELWEHVPTRRCLVPAHGWTATSSYSRVAFSPDTPPVTFAGLQSLVHVEGRRPEYTFGVFYRVMSLFPYDGSRVPVVIRPEDRMRWLTCRANEAKRMLVPPGMKVVARRIRSDSDDRNAIFGPRIAAIDD